MNLRLLSNRHLASSAFICLIAQSAWAATSPYGAYTLYSQGSGRVMAMGGVYSALSDDATSVVLNPAGAALEKWSFDAGGTNNRVDDSSQPPRSLAPGYSSSSTYAQPYSYLFYAAAGRLGPVVFGVGYSDPFEFNYDDTFSQKAKISIASYDAMASVRFSDSLAVGVGGHFKTLTESFENYQFGVGSAGKRETKSTSNSYSLGATYRTKKAGLGIAYYQGHTFTVDGSQNSFSAPAVFFRDVVVPAITTFGGFYMLSDRFMLAADIDQFNIPTNAVDPLSGVTSNGSVGSDIPLATGNQQVLHAGFEWTLTSEKSMSLIFRGGGYLEPARYVGAGPRFHRTFGLQVRFGPAVLNVSFDQADNFNNTAQGFSVVLGEI